ncbi:glycoside hydrolase family protein [Shewanella sp. D64]|uniref:glycoside hydrolase family protein n=1 Tax=unclassified Shewanella TaxID=196818 RepID=UPI0022BA3E89|nr:MULTISPECIES: glycoside hydrolase family protein [unclassified Shewanella]MEC4725817.1 glycoside hydrolase family protein [Shewanella sp. D64]MEC4737576.1 glycoside hydrolase family protein [Shewanella sp. E94]WBJ93394.1 glycoside hydrolase family protein [Shewanella sp. MTB7]
MTLLNLHSRKKLTDMLIQHEGMMLKPYRCTAGKNTIGVGRNLDDVGISQEEALMMLANDIERLELRLSYRLPWIATLSESQQLVLLNMAFNLGVGGLLRFKNMLAALERQDISSTQHEMLNSRWAGQVGKRCDDLVKMIANEK